MKIGIIVNPIAGIGAKLAWKGTDNINEAWKLIENGLEQPIWNITERALNSIIDNTGIEWYFGGNLKKFIEIDFNGIVVGELGSKTSAIDTQILFDKMKILNIDLLLFVGGDGTAVDIAKVSDNIPILGIPGGVKIFSPCFLHRPEDLGIFIENWTGKTQLIDIFDLDEDEYKKGKARAKLMGKAVIPIYDRIQSGKSSWKSDSESLDGIAERILNEKLLDNKKIIVGSGSTLQNILHSIGIEKTLLGICILDDKKIKKIDCTFQDLDKYFKEYGIDEIWLSPIGKQGHIFGRGNRQIPITIIQSIGKNGIRLFSDKNKMNNTRNLFTDTGDKQLDVELTGYYKVYTGYHVAVIRKVIL